MRWLSFILLLVSSSTIGSNVPGGIVVWDIPDGATGIRYQNSAQLRILGPNQKLSGAKSELLSKKTRLIRSIQDKLLKDDERLRSLARVLESVSPLPTLSRGYAIVRDQDSASVLTKKSQLEIGQRVVTRITDAIFVSKIEKIENTEEEGSGIK